MAGATNDAVRIFVSSTFHDLQAERDVLVKRVFPQLRRQFGPRALRLNEVDLRWGVTRAEVDEGQLLPICFAEIDRCRPFFMAILGDRYGFVPNALPSSVYDEHPWIRELAGTSVTELEIRHGVLRAPACIPAARFYVRHRAIGASPQLDALTDTLEKTGCTIRRYRTLTEFEQTVLGDLTEILDRHLAPFVTDHPLLTERRAHRRLAEDELAKYVPVAGAFDRLFQHVCSDGLPLVVSGGSGAGKTALLAAWWLENESGMHLRQGASLWSRFLGRHRKPEDQGIVVAHFVGATSASTDWASLVYRLLGELSLRFAIELEIPTKPSDLVATFRRVLAELAGRRRFVILIDGLDHLEAEADGGTGLHWLPDDVPPGVRLIVSAASEPVVDDLRQRGWDIFDCPSLSVAERTAMVGRYLEGFSKRLEPSLLARIVDAPGSRNPLWLRTNLEELRLFGSHERLPAVVDANAALDEPRQLIAAVLSRYESDFETDRPGLIGDALCLIAIARFGLAESELLELLGTPGSPLASALWSPFSLALASLLVERSGLLTFAHAIARAAVADRYLASGATRKGYRRTLVAWLLASAGVERQVDELPWQLIELQDWHQLQSCLGRPDFVDRAMAIAPLEMVRWWRTLEQQSGARADTTYRHVVDHPEHVGAAVGSVALLLRELGYLQAALRLGAWIIDRCQRTGTVDDEILWLERQALASRAAGRLDDALQLLARQQTLAHNPERQRQLRRCLGNQAVVLRDLGRLDEAIARHREEGALAEAAGDEAGVAWSLRNRAALEREVGRPQVAASLFTRAERGYRALGDIHALQACLGGRADASRELGNRRDARRASDEQERLCRRLADPWALQRCLATRANILQEDGDYDAADTVLREQQEICRSIGESAGLARGLAIKATLYANVSWIDRARAEARKAIAAAADAGDPILSTEIRTQLAHLL